MYRPTSRERETEERSESKLNLNVGHKARGERSGKPHIGTVTDSALVNKAFPPSGLTCTMCNDMQCHYLAWSILGPGGLSLVFWLSVFLLGCQNLVNSPPSPNPSPHGGWPTFIAVVCRRGAALKLYRMISAIKWPCWGRCDPLSPCIVSFGPNSVPVRIA